MKSEEVEPTMKWLEIDLGKASDWWNHTYVKHQKGFENSSGKLEESGKILGKDLWVRGHWRENTVEKGWWTDRWSTGTIEIFEWGDNLELIRTQTNLLRWLEHSRRINWREANEQGKHLIQGKEYDQPKNLNWVHRRRRRGEECQTRREFIRWNNWWKTEETPYEWNWCSKET